MEPSVQREERERERGGSSSSKIERSRNKWYERERSQRLGREKKTSAFYYVNVIKRGTKQAAQLIRPHVATYAALHTSTKCRLDVKYFDMIVQKSDSYRYSCR